MFCKLNDISNSFKSLTIMFLLSLISGCVLNPRIEISLLNKNSAILNLHVANVQIINHQVIITGTNLSGVTAFKINEGANSFNLNIESSSNTSIVANTLANVSFAAGRVFDFVLSNANASSVFTVNFSLCDSTLGGKGFNCLITPNDKDVLSFDATTNKWIPRNVNGLNYKGIFDASPTLDPAGSPLAGDYYIISVGGVINGVTYAIGDWIVYNGDEIVWEKVSNSKDVLSVFGRTGKISARKGDYNLTKMSDVDLTTVAPALNQYLKFDGTNWVPSAVSATAAGAGTVGAPSFAFSGNTNTGIYNPAANQIGLSNNGVESLRINATGSIGIGTTAPGTKLDVVSGSYNDGISYSIPLSGTKIMLTDYDLGHAMLMLRGLDNTQATYINSLGPLNIYSGGTNPDTGNLAIATDINGNVGIGTAAPVAKLDVRGAITSAVVSVANPTATGINWATGNIQYTPVSCLGSVWNITNLKEGATYTFVVQGNAHTGTCSFSDGASTFKYQPGNGTPAVGKDVIYSLMKVGTSVYVSWIDSW